MSAADLETCDLDAVSRVQGSASKGADGTLLVCVSKPEVAAVPLGTAALIDEARPRLVNDEAEVCAPLPAGSGQGWHDGAGVGRRQTAPFDQVSALRH